MQGHSIIILWLITKGSRTTECQNRLVALIVQAISANEPHGEWRFCGKRPEMIVRFATLYVCVQSNMH